MKTNREHKRRVIMPAASLVQVNGALVTNRGENNFVLKLNIPSKNKNKNNSIAHQRVFSLLLFPSWFPKMCTQKHNKSQSAVETSPVMSQGAPKRVSGQCQHSPAKMTFHTCGSSNKAPVWNAKWAANRGLNHLFPGGQSYLFGQIIMWWLHPQTPGLLLSFISFFLKSWALREDVTENFRNHQHKQLAAGTHVLMALQILRTDTFSCLFFSFSHMPHGHDYSNVVSWLPKSCAGK